MEQTINLFSKGLLLDTNPMVQSNDTLSDALNATFITQNGNEVILLNDMGNRRVDNAFLPPGYEPVGMKEYGGIIYIAAYNPITNKSQIGSFPSPERKISKFDDNSLGNDNVDFIQDFKKCKITEGLNWLIDDTLLYPLTDKNSIHAGDKFVVYGFTNDDSILNVSNYDNIKNNKVKTPLNKTYTLQLGVLNSQNEFVDITKTLIRWDKEDKVMSFEEGTTDLFKFNSGYFLAKGLSDNSKLEETQNDNNFITERKSYKLALNTYAYKLVGPLYLKATLNHIEEFNYDIAGNYDSDNKSAYLEITGYITYNCPHSKTNSKSGYHHNDEDYDVFDDEYKITSDNFFDLYNHDLLNHTVKIVPFLENKNEKFITQYNKTTNFYTTKIIKKYNISGNSIISEPDGDKFYFILGVCTPEKEKTIENNQIYLEGLSVIDVINLSMLGSGKVIPKEWRFYNDLSNSLTTLLYNLSSYPKPGQKFTNLSMELYDVYENKDRVNQETGEFDPINLWILKDTIYLSDELYNGRVTKNISWNGTKIEPRKLYYVRLKYQILDKENNNIYYTGAVDVEGNPVKADSNYYLYTDLQTYPIWLLTTKLFNSCFNKNSDDFILCYYDPKNTEIETFNRKQNIDLELELNPTINTNYDNPSISTIGNFVTKDPNDEIYGKRTHRYFNYKFSPNITIKNIEYYPDFVTIDFDKKNEIIGNLGDNNYFIQYKYKNKLYSVENINNNNEYNPSNGIVKELTSNINSNEIKYNTDTVPEIDDKYKPEIQVIYHKQPGFENIVEITNFDILKCDRITDNNIYITNAFDSIRNTTELIAKQLINNCYAAGIVVDYNNDGNDVTNAYVSVFYFNDNNGLNKSNLNLYDPENLNLFTCKFDTADGNFSKRELETGRKFIENIYDESGVSGRWPKASELSGRIYEVLNNKFPETETIYPDFLFLFNGEVVTKNTPFLSDYGTFKEVHNNENLGYYMQVYSRVWWRTSDNRWALVNKPLYMARNIVGVLHGYRASELYIISTFTNYLNELFGRDFVYCFANKISIKDAGLYIFNINNLSYTLPYSFDIEIYANFLFQNESVKDIINNSGIKLPLLFLTLGSILKIELLNKCNIKSNELFRDDIDNIEHIQLNNVYIKTGRSTDENGNLLNYKNIYIDDGNNTLKRASKDKDTIAQRIVIEENTPYNRVLYNPTYENKDYVPLHRYDIDGELYNDSTDDIHPIYLDYKGILTTPEKIT